MTQRAAMVLADSIDDSEALSGESTDEGLDDQLTDDELVSILKEQWEAAGQYYNSEIYDEQISGLDYYNAEPFGDEVDGQSQIVLPDVQEVVDYMTISVLEPFISGDRVVEFEATQEADTQGADEATDAVNQVFMHHQNGTRVLHDWLKAGLIEKYSVVKSVSEEQSKVVSEKFIATADQLAVAEPELAQTAVQMPDGTFQVTRKSVQKKTVYRDYTVPSEEFRFSSLARDEDEADYLAHASRKTRSDLVEMGFDVDTVYDLTQDDGAGVTDARAYARDRNLVVPNDSRHKSMQEVLLIEEYIRIDADGDGIAERLKVFRVDDKLLSVDIVETQPFTVFTPFPRPHRMVGDGLADKSKDIQRIRSVIARQLLNAMYQHNNPRYWVPQESLTETTIDDLLETVGPVRGRGAPPSMLGGNFDVSRSLSVLEFFTGERESRTGITRMNQGINAETLNKTATGTALMQAQGQQYELFIARNFAERLSKLFEKKMRMMKEVGEPIKIKRDGQFAESNPANWPDETTVVIRVGLGTGRKDQRVALRMQLLQIQQQALPLGLANNQGLFNNAAALVKDTGLGQPDDFFVNPARNPQAAQQPPADPEAQSQMMMAQQKLQMQQQASQAQMQIKQAEAQAAFGLEQQKGQMKAQLEREKAQTEAMLAQQKTQNEMQLARERMAMQAATHNPIDANIPDQHMGGSLES